MAGVSLATGQTGPSPSSRKRKTDPSTDAVDDEGEADMEKLERELADLDRRVLEHRRRTAKVLLDSAASHLAALRPPAALDVSMASETSIAENDREKLEKVKVIKSKYEANTAALQKVLERFNESVARIERVENLGINIHPVFLRKW